MSDIASSIREVVALRAVGCDWDRCAEVVGREVSTIRSWPSKHPDLWTRSMSEVGRGLPGLSGTASTGAPPVEQPQAGAATPRSSKDPVRNLVALNPRWLVVVLSVVSFVLTIGALILGVFFQAMFSGPFPRYVLAFAIAFFMSVFLFVFFPQQVKLTHIPLGGSLPPLRVQWAGPIALFGVVVPLLLCYMPMPASARLFRIAYPGTMNRQVAALVLVEYSGTSLEVYRVLDADGSVLGLCGVFPDGMSGNEVTIRFLLYEPFNVTLEPGEDDGIIQVPGDLRPVGETDGE